MRISDWSSDVCSSDLTGPGSMQSPDAATPASSPIQKDSRLVAQGEAFHCFFAEMTIMLLSPATRLVPKIGRASCRERVCQYVYISVGAGALKEKNQGCYMIRQTRKKI